MSQKVNFIGKKKRHKVKESVMGHNINAFPTS